MKQRLHSVFFFSRNRTRGSTHRVDGTGRSVTLFLQVSIKPSALSIMFYVFGQVGLNWIFGYPIHYATSLLHYHLFRNAN
jgi:hypothetical protein